MYDPNRDFGNIAADWWRNLQPYRHDGTPNPTADRGALARLRRSDLNEAMTDPATFDLFHRLGWGNPTQITPVALCAAVLAAVRTDNRDASVARQLGAQVGSEKPLLSVLRFRALLAADTPTDRLTMLRRAVLLNNATTHVRDMAWACLNWSEARRRRWAFDYYDTAQAAPTKIEV